MTFFGPPNGFRTVGFCSKWQPASKSLCRIPNKIYNRQVATHGFCFLGKSPKATSRFSQMSIRPIFRPIFFLGFSLDNGRPEKSQKRPFFDLFWDPFCVLGEFRSKNVPFLDPLEPFGTVLDPFWTFLDPFWTLYESILSPFLTPPKHSKV